MARSLVSANTFLVADFAIISSSRDGSTLRSLQQGRNVSETVSARGGRGGGYVTLPLEKPTPTLGAVPVVLFREVLLGTKERLTKQWWARRVT